MNQEDTEKQIRYDELKLFLGLLPQIILTKYGVLATISGLCAALLAVTTFNVFLTIDSCLLKFLISSFLVLMLLSLFLYLVEVQRGENSFVKKICDISGVTKEEALGKKNWIEKIEGCALFIIFGIFSILVFIIIALIFK